VRILFFFAGIPLPGVARAHDIDRPCLANTILTDHRMIAPAHGSRPPKIHPAKIPHLCDVPWDIAIFPSSSLHAFTKTCNIHPQNALQSACK
jgi:hypothetical protein